MAKIVYDGKQNVTVTGRALIVSTAAALVAGAVLFGGWEAGWWLRAQNTDRAASVNRQSLGFQQSRVDEITRKRADLVALRATAATSQDDAQKAQLNAQTQALTSIICADYAQLTPSYKNSFDLATLNDLASLCG